MPQHATAVTAIQFFMQQSSLLALEGHPHGGRDLLKLRGQVIGI